MVEKGGLGLDHAGGELRRGQRRGLRRGGLDGGSWATARLGGGEHGLHRGVACDKKGRASELRGAAAAGRER